MTIQLSARHESRYSLPLVRTVGTAGGCSPVNDRLGMP